MLYNGHVFYYYFYYILCIICLMDKSNLLPYEVIATLTSTASQCHVCFASNTCLKVVSKMLTDFWIHWFLLFRGASIWCFICRYTSVLYVPGKYHFLQVFVPDAVKEFCDVQVIIPGAFNLLIILLIIQSEQFLFPLMGSMISRGMSLFEDWGCPRLALFIAGLYWIFFFFYP